MTERKQYQQDTGLNNGHEKRLLDTLHRIDPSRQFEITYIEKAAIIIPVGYWIDPNTIVHGCLRILDPNADRDAIINYINATIPSPGGHTRLLTRDNSAPFSGRREDIRIVTAHNASHQELVGAFNNHPIHDPYDVLVSMVPYIGANILPLNKRIQALRERTPLLTNELKNVYSDVTEDSLLQMISSKLASAGKTSQLVAGVSKDLYHQAIMRSRSQEMSPLDFLTFSLMTFQRSRGKIIEENATLIPAIMERIGEFLVHYIQHQQVFDSLGLKSDSLVRREFGSTFHYKYILPPYSAIDIFRVLGDYFNRESMLIALTDLAYGFNGSILNGATGIDRDDIAFELKDGQIHCRVTNHDDPDSRMEKMHNSLVKINHRANLVQSLVESLWKHQKLSFLPGDTPQGIIFDIEPTELFARMSSGVCPVRTAPQGHIDPLYAQQANIMFAVLDHCNGNPI